MNSVNALVQFSIREYKDGWDKNNVDTKHKRIENSQYLWQTVKELYATWASKRTIYEHLSGPYTYF